MLRLLSQPPEHNGANGNAGGLSLPRQVLHLLHLHPAGAERDGAHLGPGPVRHVQPSDWGEQRGDGELEDHRGQSAGLHWGQRAAGAEYSGLVSQHLTLPLSQIMNS